jgi:DNA-binding FrmR family transcriptional regulator
MAAQHLPKSAPKRSSLDATTERNQELIDRLHRIEGQIRGLSDMVQTKRPCEDVAMQISAARKALDKVFYLLMASSVIGAVRDSKTIGQTQLEVERSVRLLEKFG